ncbi:CpsD/CapB family tyrosine-protein kinase [Pseudalkalibacillus sp. SCS-8]|uniref:CpsD/CapB family tyrosine-protein kinase n=1 Tax=Pseudalkalibacillus nanhaiensis TaxID=3115291 RepID=UPI0032DAD839
MGVMKERQKYRRLTSQSVEEFRTLKTHLLYSLKRRNSKSLLITSPSNQDGKSFITTHLATAFAEEGKKVLIIDANFRTPAQHHFFQVENRKGLTNILCGEKTIEDTIQKTNIYCIDLLPSGPKPPNPPQLLRSNVMSDVMEYAFWNYEIVLLDSSAILEVSDAEIISNLCEGVLLVISQDKTKVQEANEAKRILELAHANVVGITINRKG